MKGVLQCVHFSFEIQDERDVARKFLHQRQNLLGLREAFTALERCPQPVIAAVHGACGESFVVAMISNIRIKP